MNFVLKFGKISRSDARKEVSGRKRRAITEEILQEGKTSKSASMSISRFS
jgi:hypothetical protein